MKYQSKISNEATVALPALEFKGEIRIVDTEEGVKEACDYLSTHSVIGFDTETRPSFKKGVIYRVSLLQLSTDDVCYLFRLNKIALSKPIMRILESPTITKVGVDIAGDVRSLQQLRHLRARNFVELQTTAPQWGIEEKSLRKLSAIVLGERVSKAQRLSNWEAATLTPKQAQYAATDAWGALRIYNALNQS